MVECPLASYRLFGRSTMDWTTAPNAPQHPLAPPPHSATTSSFTFPGDPTSQMSQSAPTPQAGASSTLYAQGKLIGYRNFIGRFSNLITVPSHEGMGTPAPPQSKHPLPLSCITTELRRPQPGRKPKKDASVDEDDVAIEEVSVGPFRVIVTPPDSPLRRPESPRIGTSSIRTYSER